MTNGPELIEAVAAEAERNYAHADDSVCNKAYDAIGMPWSAATDWQVPNVWRLINSQTRWSA